SCIGRGYDVVAIVRDTGRGLVACGGAWHKPGRMPIGLPGTKAPLVAIVLLFATVHGGWWHWQLAVVAVLVG
ncbi:hypothetical protein Dimus_024228, partial [Dionaea muscipula]